MNLLNLDIKKYLPDIIDAYIEVYGVQYKELIKERLETLEYHIYNDLEGIEDYVAYLTVLKRREIEIKFLDKIGIDIEKYKERSLQLNYDKNIRNAINGYLGNDAIFSHLYKEINKNGIFAWSSTSGELDNNYSEQKVEFLNFVRKEESKPITEENFEEFCNTREYGEILEKIKKGLKIFEELSNEYDKFLEEMKPYHEYVRSEKQRFNDIKKRKRNEIYNAIETMLPDDIKSVLDSKCSSREEKSELLFRDEFGLKSYAEYFSSENETELIQNIRVFMINGYIQSKKEFIYGKEDFIRNTKNIKNENTKESFFEKESQRKDCIYVFLEDGKIKKRLFYHIGKDAIGGLDLILIHEIGHAIETLNDRSGFEDKVFNNKIPRNQYNPKYRKYERFNETIRDMLSMEVTDVLHKKGVYFLEPKEYLFPDIENCNTFNICKEMLRPLLDNYREEVVDVLLNGNFDKFFGKVGEENFENLVDCVNKVDFLMDNKGLSEKIQKNEVDDIDIKEYNKQLERLDGIYKNIEERQRSQEFINLLEIVEETEKKTRMGQIHKAKNVIIATINTITEKLKRNENQNIER